MAALYDSAASVLPKVNPADDGVVTINFVEDGLSAFGKVWVRGEELSVTRDTPSWEATCDRDGNSWLELTDREQYARWGEVRFREGRWAGRALTEIEDPVITDADRALLVKAEQEKAAALDAAQEPAKEPVKKPAAKKAAAKKPAEPVESSDDGDDDSDADAFLDELNKG